MKVSIVVPVYNEIQNLPLLRQELTKLLQAQSWQAEIILVDDGSTDGSADMIEMIAKEDSRFRAVRFARNFGQTAALLAGIEHATGDVLVPMDADLQNDPADIPRLLAKLNEGYDVVSGWRRNRHDKFWSRRLPSQIANRLISIWTRVRLHDYGCTLKAYRTSMLKGAQIYGEMHRFIPIYASWRGAKVTELEVNHRPRRFGTSKYGIERTLKVVLDLLTVKFLSGYTTKPAYVFGGPGLILIGIGTITGVVVIAEKILFNEWPHKPTILVLATFLVTNGVVLVSLGLLAELIVRIYHGKGGSKTYVLASEVRPDSEFPVKPPPPRSAPPPLARELR